MAIKNKVRLSLDVSPTLNDTLEKLSEETHSTKSDVLRKAIALMEIAVNAQIKGEKLALIGKDQSANTEIVGI